jgi:ABC-type nitrate/sulfonate/bicarbonate transport system ATPase subunit
MMLMMSKAGHNKVELNGVSRPFRRADGVAFWALRDIDLTVRQGEFVCLVGPSGCGKSTILNILSGLDSAFMGSATIDGIAVPLVGAGAASCSYVFQEPRLLPWLSIERNVMFVLAAQGLSKSEQIERARHWLDLVGLERFRSSYPHQLSGGMQQRASIARAFAAGQDLLLMDEPFGALDEANARNMRYELLQLWNEHRKTVIFVTHNLQESLFLGDRVVLMASNPGRVSTEVKVDIPRPRELDDPRLLELTRELTSGFFKGSELLQR